MVLSVNLSTEASCLHEDNIVNYVSILLELDTLYSTFNNNGTRISGLLDRMCIINPRCACAARVTVVGFVCLSVCVCLSVTPHLTSGGSVRPEIDVTYLTGNEGQKICGFFSETAPLRRSSSPSVVRPAYSAKVRTAWV